MKLTGGDYEVLGHIGSLRHAGLGGPQPVNSKKFLRDKGIKRHEVPRGWTSMKGPVLSGPNHRPFKY